MKDIEIKWCVEDGKRYLISDDIDTRIEIDENNKEIRQAKSFFREIIYQSFLDNQTQRIVLLEDKDAEIEEVKVIINELVELCNSDIKGHVSNDG